MAIVVLDTNTIWRKQPFQALAALRDVILMQPRDPLASLQSGQWPSRVGKARLGEGFTIWMPPGWASRWREFSCRRVLRVARRIARKQQTELTAVVITSPHYRPMVEMSSRHNLPLYYYCSDDYSNYDGWGEQVVDHEAEIVQRAAHTFFVSNALRQRAGERYGTDPARISVSPNATSDHFLSTPTSAELARIRDQFGPLAAPLVGVVGSINDRLDFALLQECLKLDSLGTLLFVGDAPAPGVHQAWDAIRSHPKCVVVGRRPHAELPAWMQLVDVALIPYRQTEFNSHCSPMRLYDHLASGKPVLATAACPQCRGHEDYVQIAESSEQFLGLLAGLFAKPIAANQAQRRYAAEHHTWQSRAKHIASMLDEKAPAGAG